MSTISARKLVNTNMEAILKGHCILYNHEMEMLTAQIFHNQFLEKRFGRTQMKKEIFSFLDL